MIAELRVLVVDAHEGRRRRLGAVLQRGGYLPVFAAEDGLEAIEQAQLLRPDIVILRWDLPVLDGITALPRLRGALEHACIVMVGEEAPARVAAALRAGADAFVEREEGPMAVLALLKSLGTAPGRRTG